MNEIREGFKSLLIGVPLTALTAVFVAAGTSSSGPGLILLLLLLPALFAVHVFFKAGKIPGIILLIMVTIIAVSFL